MGKTEAASRKRTRRANLTTLVLGTIAAAGALPAALVAPNALAAMTKLGLVPSARQAESIRVARDRLVRQGLLAREDGTFRLTDKGERALRLLELADYTIRRPRRWDGKWRVLVFDIPERRRKLRNHVRATLERIGFVRLQNSVWVFPYDCEDLVALLKADFHVGNDLLYMVADSMEADHLIRRRFDV